MYGIIDAAIAAQPSPATCGGAEGGASNKARKVGLVLAPDNRSAGKAHTCAAHTHTHTHTETVGRDRAVHGTP